MPATVTRLLGKNRATEIDSAELVNHTICNGYQVDGGLGRELEAAGKSRARHVGKLIDQAQHAPPTRADALGYSLVLRLIATAQGLGAVQYGAEWAAQVVT